MTFRKKGPLHISLALISRKEQLYVLLAFADEYV